MQRRPSTQDITWLVDLNQNKQLNLDPPYQRRSVWTVKDKQYFLDTIFRNYPSPAIFLHKTLSEDGKATYHVVDGKQRTQTILQFLADKLRMPKDFGDVRLDGKKWSEMFAEQDIRQRFWNYQLTVEMIDFVEGAVVNEVFDRLNRNARRLTAQELRHAKFEGWFITEVEAESTREDWKELGVVTTARAKRMTDSQFISELMLVTLERKLLGFDQEVLDELYGKYDSPGESIAEFNEDEFRTVFSSTKAYLLALEQSDNTVTKYARGFGQFYTLWSLVTLNNMPPAAEYAPKYREFLQKVEMLASAPDLEAFLHDANEGEYTAALSYFNNLRGASTDLGPRTQRLEALKKATL